MDFTQQINEKSKELEALLKKKQKEARKFTADLEKRCRDFLEENPGYFLIIWEQFTPLWNDGEPCNFSLGELYLGKKEDDGEWDDCGTRLGDEEIYSIEAYSEKGYREFYRFLKDNKDTLEYIFGDPTKVKIYLNEENNLKVEVEETDIPY